MRFGLFGGAQARRGDRDSARGFRDYVETCVEAEALGFDSSFLVEHHFGGVGQVSASLDLLAWVAARTTTLRLGTAVIVLPWHDPVLLAERAATLDLMSGGRLEFGVGKGYRHAEFTGFCMSHEEAEGRFEESLQVILNAWTSDERFSHRGRFWRYEDIIVEPATAQQPHPRVWIAAGKPESIRGVAARGCNLLVDQFASTEAIGERLALFRSECEARGRTFDPMDVAVARNLYVARDAADGQAALERLALARADDRPVAASGRPPSIAHRGLRRHSRRHRGKRPVQHARPDRRRTPGSTRRRCQTRIASRWRVDQTQHPAVLHRDHADVRPLALADERPRRQNSGWRRQQMAVRRDWKTVPATPYSPGGRRQPRAQAGRHRRR
jgi:alkanesulfonate monooxygenase SsuD/methylene tetrahydromethanopterin reductase-like flavin-dependent oxidoreductase (luciferase family)